MGQPGRLNDGASHRRPLSQGRAPRARHGRFRRGDPAWARRPLLHRSRTAPPRGPRGSRSASATAASVRRASGLGGSPEPRRPLLRRGDPGGGCDDQATRRAEVLQEGLRRSAREASSTASWGSSSPGPDRSPSTPGVPGTPLELELEAPPSAPLPPRLDLGWPAAQDLRLRRLRLSVRRPTSRARSHHLVSRRILGLPAANRQRPTPATYGASPARPALTHGTRAAPHRGNSADAGLRYGDPRRGARKKLRR